MGIGYGPITVGVVRAARAHHAAGPHGADLLDQADRRARGRGAGRRPAAGARARPRTGASRSSRSPPRARRRGRGASRRAARSTFATPDRKVLFAARRSSRRCRSSSRTPQLLELSLAGFAFAAVQVCLSSFLVVYLTDALRLVAGRGGVSAHLRHNGRCAWTHDLGRDRGPHAGRDPRPGRDRRASRAFAASRWRCPARPGRRASSCSPWPRSTVSSAIGWNGVQLSELARRAPPGAAGIVTGASGFITFGGVMVGPIAVRSDRGRHRRLSAGFPRCAPSSAGSRQSSRCASVAEYGNQFHQMVN